MLRRYELNDDEWNRIVNLLPPENTGKRGRPRKCNRSGWHAVVHPGVTFRNVMDHGKPFTVAFVNGLKTVYWIIFSGF
mgnify:CR=1 FL=1